MNSVWIKILHSWKGAFIGAAVLALGLTATLAGEGKEISSLEHVELGGVRQAVLIRGQNRTNPVLLFVHGGPGVCEMPFSYKNKELEREFIVVQWDQRGAGKSYRANTPGMNIDRFVRDTLELSEYLGAQFGQHRIYLAGHSWGSWVALEAVERRPRLFHAYVGISQLVSIPASERELDERSRSVARLIGNQHALREIEQLGHYPYPNHGVERKVNQIQKKLMGEVPHEFSLSQILRLALLSPYYSPVDYAHLISGISFSGHALEKQIYAANLFKTVPRVDVPIYFFEGRRDTVLSPVVGERFFRQLIAPRGKHLIWFEESNHWPQFEEPQKYREMMRRVLRETSRS